MNPNEITLNQADLDKLTALIAEVPYKYAAPMIVFINEKLAAHRATLAAADSVLKAAAEAKGAPPARKNGRADAQATA